MTTGSVTTNAAGYLRVLHRAYSRHYTERTDVWTDDLAMRCVPAVVQGQLKLPPSARALDIGCGSGRDVEYLSRVIGDVVGIDILPHPEWDRIAGESPSRVTFEVTDLLSYRSTIPFDLVLDNGCFHHQHEEHHVPYLLKVSGMLAPGGWFVLSTFKNPGLDEYVDAHGRLHRYFTDDELRHTLVRGGLEVASQLEIHRLGKGDFYRLSFCRSGGTARAAGAAGSEER